MQLRIGLEGQWVLPTGPDAHRLAEVVAQARDAGLDHLGLGDHISFHDGMGFDGLINAMAVLASAPDIGVHIGVYLLPLRHPVLVARQLATIAERAPGRLVVACGIAGEDPGEVAMCGVDPATRGARADECLGVLRGLLSGQPTSHQGRFFSFEDARILPAPSPPVPLLVGGRSDAALERAARAGDGWHGIWVSSRRFRAATEGIAARARELGRDVPAYHAMTFWCGFDHDGVPGRERVSAAMTRFYGIPFERFERYIPTGTPEQIAAFVAPYTAAGCRAVTIVAAGVPGDAAIAYAARVREVLVG